MTNLNKLLASNSSQKEDKSTRENVKPRVDQFLTSSSVSPSCLPKHVLDNDIDWLDLFELCNHPIIPFCNQIRSQQPQNVAPLQVRFPEVFTPKTVVQLVLVFRPKRPVAYSIKSVVEDELSHLQSLSIIKHVDFADWAAPIVVVRKPNGSVRIWADFSTGHNNGLEPTQYPLPLPEVIFAKMANYRIFSHIDLSDAYLQVYSSLPGCHQAIKPAPGSFQQLMGTMLAGIDCTVGYLDDIHVGGRSEEDHKRNIYLVLERLREHGFTVSIENCNFGRQQMKYIGQVLDGNGIRPDPDKIASIISMPPPHDISTLRSYLVSCVSKIVRPLSKDFSITITADELHCSLVFPDPNSSAS
ncbi:uncharacterized protein K02A2.6-like [Topomyia yanbarensis]|uniref:uncharacterized protein K02A2.6-like n=1 Tax=Topomyia yanbarensis TaxID=2498891 RepID=UPI00273BA2B6|nr:uncharacterized protein K02A2.6-like [Topomyia yanbarensis]